MRDEVMGVFEGLLGKDDKHGYHCNKCDYEMTTVSVKTTLEGSKKLFYCRNKFCNRFGLITVVAKKKDK